MKKKILYPILTLAVALGLTGCADSYSVGVIGGADGPTEIIVGENDYNADYVENNWYDEEVPSSDSEDSTDYEQPPTEDSYALDIDGTYNSVEDVSLYLHEYGFLPDNYITKNEARSLGWEGGSVEDYAGTGYAIGGDKFGNREGRLPTAEGRQYYECDIDTVGQNSRGAKRLVYSNDGLIYYTDDHYESFTLLYGEE